MPAGVDPLGIIDGAMIHPHDRFALGRVSRAHRQGTRIAVKRDQRAGCVEAHAADGLGRQPRRLDRFADRGRHRAPDVVGRLLDNIARLAPDGDRSPGAGDELSDRIEDTRPGAERADVHSDIGLAHGIPGVACGGRILRFRRRWQAGALKIASTPRIVMTDAFGTEMVWRRPNWAENHYRPAEVRRTILTGCDSWKYVLRISSCQIVSLNGRIEARRMLAVNSAKRKGA